MPLTKSLIDLAWVAGPKVTAGGLQLLTNLLLVRQFGPARSGTAFVCMTGILLCDAVLGTAVDVAVVRIATGSAGSPRFLEIQKAALVAKTIGWLVLAIPVVIWSDALSAILFHADADAPLLVLSMMSLLGLLVLRSTQTYFQIGGCFRAYGVADLLHSVLRFGGIGVLFAVGLVTPGTVLILVAVAPLSIAVGLLATSARRLLLAPFSTDALSAVVEVVKWYLGAAAVASFNTRVDVMLVSAMVSTAAAGMFSAAQVCVLPFQLLGMYLAVVFAPRILPLWECNRLAPVYFRFQAWTTVAAVLTFGTAFFSVDAVAVRLLPSAYDGTAHIVLLLLPSSLTALINFPWTVSFLMFTRPRLLFLMELCACPLLLLGYRWVVRSDGAAGAAMITSGYALVKTVIYQAIAGFSIRRRAVSGEYERVSALSHGIRSAAV